MQKKLIIGVVLSIFLSTFFLWSSVTPHEIPALKKKLETVTGKEKIDTLVTLSKQVNRIAPAKGIEYARQALSLAKELGDFKGEAGALINISTGHRMIGKKKKALEFAQQAIKAAEKSGDKHTTAAAFNNAGIHAYFISNYDRSLEYFQKAMEYRRQINDKKGIAESWNNIGNVHLTRSNLDEALRCYGESLNIHRQMNDKLESAKVLNNIGAIYSRKSDFEKALEIQLEALKQYREIGDKPGIANSLNNIGALYGNLENYSQALEYFLDALEIKKKIGNKRDIANSMDNIGKCYKNLGNNKKALEFVRESLKLNIETGNKWGISENYLSMGSILAKQNISGQAMKHFRDALVIKEEIGDKRGVVKTLYFLSQECVKLNRFREGEKQLNRALTLTRETKENFQLQSIYEAFADLYSAEGNFEKALAYYRKFADTRDKIFTDTNSKQLADAKARYDTLKKEKRILLLEKESEIEKLRTGRERMARNVFIGGFGVVSVFLLLLFKRYLYLFAFWKKEKYISRFRLTEEIGTGGMGVIFKAHDTRDKTDTVAIKVLKPELFKDESNRKRFKQEAAIIDRLEHPNIVKIYERGEYKNKLYIAMEYLNGKPLDEVIKEEPRLPLSRSIDIMRQIAGAIEFIHDKNIIHRDVKPSNIMLTRKDGKPGIVKLLDFGLARARFQTRITRTGFLMGTLNYMAPEQLTDSQCSTASDIFSLGTAFYEMLSGEIAFPGEYPNDIMKQILDSDPVEPYRFNREIPDSLNGLVIKMMAKNKEDRPRIKEVIETLEAVSLPSNG